MIYLLGQYADNLCTPEETDELFDIIKASQEDETLHAFLQEQWDHLQIEKSEKQPDWNRLFEAIRPAPVIPLYRRTSIRWIAAAAIIMMIVGGWWMIERRSQDAGHKSQVAIHDVPAPTNTRAVITLADGSKVYLDSASNGTIAQQNNVNVVKNNEGEIQYKLTANSQQLTAYNTLFNPRGSKVISLTLSDGTKVWLNSESSLRYPASFAPSALNREVEITGEAYFEVKHNSKQPFKVHLPNGSIVEDIGTSFNINAYGDEADIKTTLIEGSVKLSPAGGGDLNGSPNNKRPGVDNGTILKPGEQAVINNPANPSILKILVQDNVDVDEVMSWKNGRFSFTDASIETILKEISRYYDAEIIYQDEIPGQFVADISRDVPVSKLLQILELTNRVHFKIEGKRITVMK
jgi:ferric-dicitrate binding protein FerR (iron transport regulator)